MNRAIGLIDGVDGAFIWDKRFARLFRLSSTGERSEIIDAEMCVSIMDSCRVVSVERAKAFVASGSRSRDTIEYDADSDYFDTLFLPFTSEAGAWVIKKRIQSVLYESY